MTKTQKRMPTSISRIRKTSKGGVSTAKPAAVPEFPAAATAAAPKAPSKQQQLAALLLREEGATLEQMTAATGWLPHTTRAALTGLKKKGCAISSDKIDGVRTYRAVAPE